MTIWHFAFSFRSKHEEIDLVSIEEFYMEAPPEISNAEVTMGDPHQQTLARLDWELEQRKRWFSALWGLDGLVLGLVVLHDYQTPCGRVGVHLGTKDWIQSLKYARLVLYTWAISLAFFPTFYLFEGMREVGINYIVFWTVLRVHVGLCQESSPGLNHTLNHLPGSFPNLVNMCTHVSLTKGYSALSWLIIR